MGFPTRSNSEDNCRKPRGHYNSHFHASKIGTPLSARGSLGKGNGEAPVQFLVSLLIKYVPTYCNTSQWDKKERILGTKYKQSVPPGMRWGNHFF